MLGSALTALTQGKLFPVSLPVYLEYVASYGFSFCQLPVQCHSEDASLSLPICHASVSALSAVTEHVSPESQGQY